MKKYIIIWGSYANIRVDNRSFNRWDLIVLKLPEISEGKPFQCDDRLNINPWVRRVKDVQVRGRADTSSYFTDSDHSIEVRMTQGVSEWSAFTKVESS